MNVQPPYSGGCLKPSAPVCMSDRVQSRREHPYRWLARGLGAATVMFVFVVLGTIVYPWGRTIPLQDQGLRVAILQIVLGPLVAFVLSVLATLSWPRLFWMWGMCYGAPFMLNAIMRILLRFRAESIAPFVCEFGTFLVIAIAGILGGIVARHVRSLPRRQSSLWT